LPAASLFALVFAAERVFALERVNDANGTWFVLNDFGPDEREGGAERAM